MKKFSLAITMLAMYYITCMQANAQLNSNTTGVWTGTDNMNSAVEITFNNDHSCVFKINGTPSYNINSYRFLYEDPYTGVGYDLYHPIIYFYASVSVTSNDDQISFEVNDNLTDTERKSYKCYGVFNSTFDALTVTSEFNVFNNGSDEAGYIINLTK